LLSCCSTDIRTLCPLYSVCARTLGLLCASNRVVALVSIFLFCMLLLIFRCVHSAVTPGESRFRLHCNEALVMGINAKLRRDINSPDFSTCLGLLRIQLVWIAVDLTSSYHSLNRVVIKLHNRSTGKYRLERSLSSGQLRPQPTRRNSWKLVANPDWQPGFPTSCQLVHLMGCGLYGTLNRSLLVTATLLLSLGKPTLACLSVQHSLCTYDPL